MSGNTGAEELYSAIEEAARLVGAPCARELVQPILTAYGAAHADGGIVFSAQTGEAYAGELDYAFSIPPAIGDPHAHALANGFVAPTDHPVGALLTDITARCEVTEHFADCSVSGGLRKLYAHFPRDLQSVSALSDIPSMPRAVAENASLFARYGLENVVMIGGNYGHRTVSLYFQFTPDGRPAPSTIGALLRELGLSEEDERMLEFAHRSFRANITLGWDSAATGRVTFAPPPGPGRDLSEVPAPTGPPRTVRDPRSARVRRGAHEPLRRQVDARREVHRGVLVLPAPGRVRTGPPDGDPRAGGVTPRGPDSVSAAVAHAHPRRKDHP